MPLDDNWFVTSTHSVTHWVLQHHQALTSGSTGRAWSRTRARPAGNTHSPTEAPALSDMFNRTAAVSLQPLLAPWHSCSCTGAEQ